MSGNVVGRGSGALCPTVRGDEHVGLAEQQAAARSPVTPELASGDPPVDGANLDPAQQGHFALGQELFIRSATVPHARLPRSLVSKSGATRPWSPTLQTGSFAHPVLC